MTFTVVSRLTTLVTLLLAVPFMRAAEPATGSAPPAGETKAVDPTSFFRPGEVLTFRLGYSIFTNAGTVRFETFREDTPEGPRIRVVVKTATQGLVESVYSLNNTVISIIDAETGRPLEITSTGNASSRKTDEVTVFNYDKHELVYTDSARPSRSKTVTLPDEPMYDIMVTMMSARLWNLKVGESKDVLAPFGSDFYQLKVTALREETVKTPVGKFKAIVLEPKQQGELKGMFKKGGGFKFYISTGEKPQIVRLEIKINSWITIGGNITKVEMKDPPPPSANDATGKPDEKKDANPAP